MSFEPIIKNNTTKVSVWDLNHLVKQPESLVIREKAFTIQINEVGSFTLLCTPIGLEELALGFTFTEGLIVTKDDVLAITQKNLPEPIISLQIRHPEQVRINRNLIVTSGCGMCGKDNIENLLFSIPILKNNFKFNKNYIVALETNIESKQHLFHATRGTHVAAIFNDHGEVVSIQEDVGRHNALDKAIGYCLKNGILTPPLGVFLSSRTSFEMVAKAARAGIELIMGISAPTDLAIKAADYWNITLCCFVRNGKGNIYTAKERIYN